MSEPVTSAALEELVREHAALRPVATLVVREPSPSEVFAAVTREVGMPLGAAGNLWPTAPKGTRRERQPFPARSRQGIPVNIANPH